MQLVRQRYRPLTMSYTDVLQHRMAGTTCSRSTPVSWTPASSIRHRQTCQKIQRQPRPFPQLPLSPSPSCIPTTHHIHRHTCSHVQRALSPSSQTPPLYFRSNVPNNHDVYAVSMQAHGALPASALRYLRQHGSYHEKVSEDDHIAGLGVPALSRIMQSDP